MTRWSPPRSPRRRCGWPGTRGLARPRCWLTCAQPVTCGCCSWRARCGWSTSARTARCARPSTRSPRRACCGRSSWPTASAGGCSAARPASPWPGSTRTPGSTASSVRRTNGSSARRSSRPGRRGIDADGPLSADTLFPRAAAGQADLVVAMYHDQGHIPVKLLGRGEGVAVTLGLPFLRMSPDHGAAFDIAGQGVARPGSMTAAIAGRRGRRSRSSAVTAGRARRGTPIPGGRGHRGGGRRLPAGPGRGYRQLPGGPVHPGRPVTLDGQPPPWPSASGPTRRPAASPAHSPSTRPVTGR